MNIAISGYYGMGNFGDELFLKTFQQFFSEHNIFPWSSYIDLAQIDAVIIGGGDLLIPYHFNEVYFPRILSKIPTWVYGVGVVTYYPEDTWPKEEVRKYQERLQLTNGLYLRDENSGAVCKKYNFNKNVHVVPDLVFSYRQPDYPIKPFSTLPTIGITVFNYDSFPLEKMVNIFVDLSRHYHLLLLPVVNQTVNKFSDFSLCQKIKEQIQEKNPNAKVTLPQRFDIDITYSFIQSLDYLLSFKMHPSLVAIRNQVPVFCFTTGGKIVNLLKQFDLEDFHCSYLSPEEEIKGKITLFLKEGKEKVKKTKNMIRLKEIESDKNLLNLKKEIERYSKHH